MGYTRNCHTFQGLNDKVIFMTGGAAQRILIGYSQFLSCHQKACPNAEAYIMRLAEGRKVKNVKVAFKLLPAVDATFMNATDLLHKTLYGIDYVLRPSGNRKSICYKSE